MKLYTKKEKKLSGRFWEINILSEKLTTTTTTTTTDDGRRTTDESALEKLRCLSAGGAKKTSLWRLFPVIFWGCAEGLHLQLLIFSTAVVTKKRRLKYVFSPPIYTSIEELTIVKLAFLCFPLFSTFSLFHFFGFRFCFEFFDMTYKQTHTYRYSGPGARVLLSWTFPHSVIILGANPFLGTVVLCPVSGIYWYSTTCTSVTSGIFKRN